MSLPAKTKAVPKAASSTTSKKSFFNFGPFSSSAKESRSPVPKAATNQPASKFSSSSSVAKSSSASSSMTSNSKTVLGLNKDIQSPDADLPPPSRQYPPPQTETLSKALSKASVGAKSSRSKTNSESSAKKKKSASRISNILTRSKDSDEDSLRSIPSALENDANLSEFEQYQQQLEPDPAVRYADLQPYIEQALHRGSVPINRYKIMFLGQGRGGKTATIRNILGELFSEQVDSTVGIDEFTASVSMAAKAGAGVWRENAKPPSELAYGVAASALKQRQSDAASQRALPIDASASDAAAAGADASSNTPSPPADAGPDLGSEISEEVVMRCVGETTAVSDVLLAIYDYGGQSVFNVIHHLFLTANGLYVVVFNMQWMLSSDRSVRDRCMQELRFWLQSVYIHTYREDTNTTSPVILVGTRGDVVTSAADYQALSAQLSQELYQILCLLSLTPNTARGLSFFPINNRAGNSSRGAVELMAAVEAVVLGSADARRETPLLWLRTLDRLQEEKRSCLSYEEVCGIAASCGVGEEEVSPLLQFWRGLGMLLWVDEPGLRDRVVLDAIRYLVQPATRAICQHNPDADAVEAVVHHSSSHAECARRFPVDWSVLKGRGVLSDRVLSVLWADRPAEKPTLLMLMAKFGLLMPVVESRPAAAGGDALYLIPALLPPAAAPSLWAPVCSESCLFLFLPAAHSGLPTVQGCVSLEEQRRLGFLPVGLFERIAVRVIAWCQTQLGSGFSLSDLSMDRHSVVLPFGRSAFRLTDCPQIHSIRLDVSGNCVHGVYRRVRSHIEAVLRECFRCLTVFAARLCAVGPDGSAMRSPDYSLVSDQPTGQAVLLFIDKLQSTIDAAGAAQYRHRLGVLSREEIMWLHGAWMQCRLPSDAYDVFISYRWNDWDTDVATGLYDALMYYTIGDESRSLNLFVDQKCLENGSRFDEAFASALARSTIAVPVVSFDALERLATHKADQIDNLLLEWVMMLICERAEQCSLRCIYPIMIGRRVRGERPAADITITDLFTEQLFNDRSCWNVVPVATLMSAKEHLLKQNISIGDEARVDALTLWDIVHNGILKFMGYQAWKELPRDLFKYCAPQLVGLLRKVNANAATADSTSGDPTAAGSTTATIPSYFPIKAKDVQLAWEFIKDGYVAAESNRAEFLALMDDLGIDDAESLAYICVREKEQFGRLLGMMKLAKRHKFRDLLAITEGSYH